MIVRYEIGKISALQQFDGDDSREAILSAAMVASADPDPDEFTAGWLAACEEKMQELYGESTKEVLNDRRRDLEFDEFYRLQGLYKGIGVPCEVIKNWLLEHREHILKFLTDSPVTIEGFKHD